MHTVDEPMSAVEYSPLNMRQKRGKNEESNYGNQDRYDPGLPGRRHSDSCNSPRGWPLRSHTDGDAKERITTVDKNGKKEVAHRHGVGKAMKGHFDKAGVSVKKHVREFLFENASEYKLGDEIKADIFAEGDKIDATAVTKGKGFQGAIKRHGQHRGPMGHGSKFHRHQGSNGSSSDPSRVFKGKGMPGHMGSVQVTVRNLEIVRVDAEKNLLLVKGAIPGPKKGLVTIKETTKADA